jgi:hypothetical protein
MLSGTAMHKGMHNICLYLSVDFWRCWIEMRYITMNIAKAQVQGHQRKCGGGNIWGC